MSKGKHKPSRTKQAGTSQDSAHTPSKKNKNPARRAPSKKAAGKKAVAKKSSVAVEKSVGRGAERQPPTGSKATGKKVAGRKATRPERRLLPGEAIEFRDESEKLTVSDEVLNSRYVKGDVRIVTEAARYPLAGILNMLQETVKTDDGGETELRYELDPEYQRRHRWSKERKSRLIESFLMNVPVPPVFLYERDLARFEVMDGRQRLTALSQFYADEFALEGLEYWSDLNGRKYSELPSKIRDGIDRRYISSIILLKETAADDEQAAMLKKLVFERLNSGGVRLSSQETRNAIYDGPLNQLCMKLSKNECYRRMWGIPLEPTEDDINDDNEEETTGSEDESTKSGERMYKSMEDVEIVLRFFAYRQIDKFKAGLNRISAFLDRFLIQGNGFPTDILDAYEDLFDSTVEFLWECLGHDAYRVIGTERSRQPTKVVFDPIMYVASLPEVKDAYPRLKKNKRIFRGQMERMYREHEALFGGRRTNFSDAQQRNARVQEAFSAAIERATRP